MLRLLLAIAIYIVNEHVYIYYTYVNYISRLEIVIPILQIQLRMIIYDQL